MKNIDSYITEKLKIDKNINVSDNTEETNKKFIVALKNYCNNEFNIKFDTWENSIVVTGKENDIILLTFNNKKNRAHYWKIMNFVNQTYPIAKKCSSNNQSIYIYPKYD